MKKIKFGIGIPTLCRLDLLYPALMYYVNDYKGVPIHILDNGKQNIASLPSIASNKNIHIHESEKNIGVAASWNFLLREIYKKHDYALILNDDIYLDKPIETIWLLLAHFEEYRGMRNQYLSFMTAHKDFSAFLMPKQVFESVGYFDEKFFPAYFEDIDYIQRCKMNNVFHMRSLQLQPSVHKNTSSIPSIKNIEKYHKANQKYWNEKWNGLDAEIVKDNAFNHYFR